MTGNIIVRGTIRQSSRSIQSFTARHYRTPGQKLSIPDTPVEVRI